MFDAGEAMTTLSAANLSNGLRFAWMLAKRDLRNRYASSYAGAAWNIGVPLLYALINVVVFSLIMKGRMDERYDNVPFDRHPAQAPAGVSPGRNVISQVIDHCAGGARFPPLMTGRTCVALRMCLARCEWYRWTRLTEGHAAHLSAL
jgi:hypothetical protein